MPRAYTTDELDIVLGVGVNHYLYVMVADADGTLQDCADLGDLHLDMLDGTTFGESLDTPVSTGTLTIRRDTSFDSAAPTMGDSSINRNALGDYAPLFEKGRAIFMQYAVTAQGVAPTEDDKRPLFQGRIDGVHWHDNPMTIDISDIGAWVADAQIREAKRYASNSTTPGDGPLLGEVIQNMIDDAMPDSGITLVEPDTIEFQPYADDPQQPGSLFTAARNWALEIGADLRYRWDEDDNFALTLFMPARDNTTSDWTFGPDNYSKLGNLATSIADIRNDIIVQYKDIDGNLQTEEATDATSIAKYGGPGAVPRLWFIPSSAIRNATDANGLANAVLSDLSEADADQEIELPFFPFVQIGDLATFQANGDHYDSDQVLAVVSYQHRFEKGEGATTIQTRGKVAGAYRAWIKRPGSTPAIPPNITKVPRPVITPFIHSDTHAVDAIVDVDPSVTTIKVAESTTHVPSASDVRATDPIDTGGLTRITVAGVITELVEGVTAYISALAYDASANESPVASVGVALATEAGTESPPSIELIYATPNGITGLTVDVGLYIVTPRNLGGTLRIWTNHDSTTSPDSTSGMEGSVVFGSTPNTANELTNFTVQPSGVGTFKYLNDIRVHPTAGKIIFAEYVDEEGRSSGQLSFVLNGGGGDFDANGNLKTGAIFSPAQITDGLISAPKIVPGLTVPQSVATVGLANPAVSKIAITPDGLVYRWNGSSWIATTDAVQITGQLVSAQIATGAIGPTQFASSIAPVQIAANVGAMNSSISHIALNTTDGLTYVFGSSGWIAMSDTRLIVGQLVAGQISAGAIGTTQLAALAVTAGKIAVGSITADKMLISAYGNALNADPDTQDITAWQNAVSIVDLGTGGKAGRFALQSVGFSGTVPNSAIITVDPLKTYRVRGWARRIGADGSLYIGCQALDGTGANIAGPTGSYWYCAAAAAFPAVDGTWYEYIGYIGANAGTYTLPSTAKQLRLIVLENYGGSTGVYQYQGLRVEEVLPGTLIQDGVITTAKLAALSVTSDILAANSAIFGKVAAGAIGVDQIRANSVGANQIIAGSIQADKLLITYAPGGALNSDPWMNDISAWVIDAGPGITGIGASGIAGPNCLWSGVATAGYYRSRQIFPFDPAKTYRVHGWVYSSLGTAILYLGVNGQAVGGGNTGGMYISAASGITPPPGWTEYSGNFDANQMAIWGQSPATTKYIQLYALLNYAAVSAGYMLLQDFRIEEVMPGTLIKDGAITTQKLTATTVTAGVMSIASLQSISPNMGIITSGKLQGPGGMFLDLNAAGGNPVLHGTQFNLNADGTAVFAGTLAAASGSFSGVLSAATGTFSGTLSAANGSFTGSLSGATGSFAGSLSAASGSFAGDISGATGTFSGVVASASFVTTDAYFSGFVNMWGTLRIRSGSGLGDDSFGSIRFYATDFSYVYGKIYLDPSTFAMNLQANGGINLDTGNTGLNITGQDRVRIMRNASGTSSCFEVYNDSFGALFVIDVPTGNNWTGIQTIYRDQAGSYSFKRLLGDNVNTGGSGNRNIRVAN